jgi:hypothetical protein
MDSFFKQLDKGLDSIAGKIDKMEKKWNEGGGAGDEGVGDVYSINGSRYRIVKKLAEGAPPSYLSPPRTSDRGPSLSPKPFRFLFFLNL